MIYHPIILRLHGLLIGNVFDFNFMGSDFYDHMKTLIKSNRCKSKPHLMSVKTDGVANHIAETIFEVYFNHGDHGGLPYLTHNCAEGILSDMWLLTCFMEHHEFDKIKPYTKLMSFLKRIDEKFDTNENFYFEFLDRHNNLIKDFFSYVCYQLTKQPSYITLKKKYSRILAERVLFDRELCKFIVERLMESGMNGQKDFGEKKISRPSNSFPNWVKKLLKKRDPKCLSCGKESDKLTIDHIIPLSEGGFNDVINFQLLCAECNKEKDNRSKTYDNFPPLFKRRGNPLKIKSY